MAKIIVITDFSDEGSGYKNLCTPLLTGLVEMGHEIKIAGMGYQGKEHPHPFSVIPAGTIQDMFVIASNLRHIWNPDIIIVAMDIPLQQFFYENLAPTLNRTQAEIDAGITTPIKYMAITPLENGPLTMSWAAILLNMDFVFFISELGKQEALKAGLSKVDHLYVGVDTVLWHPATPEEKSHLRKGLGIGEEEFVVLTVADNQERKNLWAGMESIKLLKQQTDRKIRYILVTRTDSQVGWKFPDAPVELGINKEIMTFNRGIPVEDLWGLYAVSDVYLQPSKAEGLGMPVLEAMACGILCVATDTGALHELLDDGRGLLIDAAYLFRDVWGNSSRSMLDTSKTAKVLYNLSVAGDMFKDSTRQMASDLESIINKSLSYVRSRKWEVAVNQVNDKIMEITQ